MDFIQSEKAPAAIGPYSQAVKSGNLVFCSGQIALTRDGVLCSEKIVEQMTQVLENLKAVLESAGSDLNKVLKVTLFLTDLKHFGIVNEIYALYFGDHKPARSTIQVEALPRNALVEIECIAII